MTQRPPARMPQPVDRSSAALRRRAGLATTALAAAAPSVRRVPAYLVRPAGRGGWRWLLRGHPPTQSPQPGRGTIVAGAATTAPTVVEATWEVLRVRVVASAAPTEVVPDRHGGWRWRLLSRAGQVVAVSAVGFASQWAAQRALERFRQEASHAELVDQRTDLTDPRAVEAVGSVPDVEAAEPPPSTIDTELPWPGRDTAH